MVEIGFFLSEVLVVFLMLTGMIIGDIAASLRFGRIKGKIRQFFYLFLFVIFLVTGNYIPSFFNLQLDLYEAIIFFSFWGFASVFTSRFLLFVCDCLQEKMKSFFHSRENLTRVDKTKLARSLSLLDLDLKNRVLQKAYGKEKKDLLYLNAETFEDSLSSLGVRKKDRVKVMVIGLDFSPEEASYLVYSDRSSSFSPQMQ